MSLQLDSSLVSPSSSNVSSHRPPPPPPPPPPSPLDSTVEQPKMCAQTTAVSRCFLFCVVFCGSFLAFCFTVKFVSIKVAGVGVVVGDSFTTVIRLPISACTDSAFPTLHFRSCVAERNQGYLCRGCCKLARKIGHLSVCLEAITHRRSSSSTLPTRFIFSLSLLLITECTQPTDQPRSFC